MSYPTAPFRAVHVAAEDWAHAAKACADELGEAAPGERMHWLGFLYVTDLLAEDLASILTYLRQKTGIEHWVGSIGIGICANSADPRFGGAEYFDRPAIAVMAGELPAESFHVLSSCKDGIGELAAETRHWMAASGAHFGIVHGDPTNPQVPALISDLAEATTGFLVGGLTSSRDAGYQIAERVTGGGLSGVLFAPAVEVATTLSQGCRPISESHVISDCLDNVLIGLDGRPALDVFIDDIGPVLARDLGSVAGEIHAALPIEGSDTGDYMVRNLVGIDTKRGWLAIGEEVAPGDRVLFVSRDANSADADLKTSLEALKGRLSGPPRGGLYFSCAGRGPAMFELANTEIERIRECFGPLELVGFFGNGEISGDRLYGYSGVLVLFV